MRLRENTRLSCIFLVKSPKANHSSIATKPSNYRLIAKKAVQENLDGFFYLFIAVFVFNYSQKTIWINCEKEGKAVDLKGAK